MAIDFYEKSRLLKFQFLKFFLKTETKYKPKYTSQFNQEGDQFISLCTGRGTKGIFLLFKVFEFLNTHFSSVIYGKQIKKLCFAILILISMILTSCGSYTIEQQVERLMNSESSTKRQTISYVLADSLSIRPCELLMGLYSNPKAEEALQNMMVRYSELIINQPDHRYQVLACIQYLTEPKSKPIGEINQLKIALIIHALQIKNLNKQYEETLINSAKLFGNIAMEKIIENWYGNKRVFRESSNSIFNSIKSFDKEAVLFLSERIQNDTIAVDLLARFGKLAVETMQEKMKDESRSIRSAAGEVLVKMQKYEPGAIKILTSAIDLGGTKIIADNYPFYIRLGQNGTEKLLSNALDIYFNENMCLDYLNCGNKELESNASGIAAKHGYLVMPRLGSHGGPRWGIGN